MPAVLMVRSGLFGLAKLEASLLLGAYDQSEYADNTVLIARSLCSGRVVWLGEVEASCGDVW